MSVYDNLAFGLKLRKVGKDETKRRVLRAATTLGIEEYLDRKPRALSGGQRQRVAMGRAIVREPRAFLMDEPLSNLDAKLRVQVRAEIQTLQRTLGITSIYVTHDQTEAMTMGDRIAVMRDGRLQQVDAPDRVYERPANQFVAGFIGSPAMNMVRARLTRDDGMFAVRFGEHALVLDGATVAAKPALAGYEGKDVIIGIRPEHFGEADGDTDRTIDTTCTLRESLGSEVLLHFPIVAGDSTATFVARMDPQSAAREAKQMRLTVDTRRMHFFDPASGGAVY
jgi:multiple sugar transport system ATP-binding protein